MKALSVTRPWPALLLELGKDVENRTWPTRHRGPLWIHAARSWDRHAIGWAEQRGLIPAGVVSPDPAEHPTGVVGVVDLDDVVRDHPSPWATPDQWHWHLTNPRTLATAVPCRGRLGLWTVPGDIADRVNAIRLVPPAQPGRTA
jgi:hypothetical protein